ncbi:hypothetical protein FE391_03730 [Nonomuraea sp. KC401]|uniref:hypothetical protein n=1 Tax=unclassified Nonomuraea TaxID=2593643 RepID=UPI0010FE1F8B|nr:MULTISPECIES: hypothetical protein [unclassified Nonomuraea]NBE92660.1 hypothetical protein [Nonomuraea sp. K271]TLF84611.1 hypothetical protein FE391_03730 [Nonomuraea sp. KC401]
MERLTAHWAILGKTPESLDDYGVIRCSTGAITNAEFGMWLKAFTSGTMEPKALPRVATSYFTAGPGGEPWLGLSLQREPDSQDGFHRPYAMTYYVCVRWADLVAGGSRVSYRALYEALAGQDFSGDAPFLLSPAAYDERRLAAQVNPTARRAAALLLTGRPVCVVRAGHLSPDRRLDFLDAVAALLPYGFRHTLAVSTWTNSASLHRIRLSFAEVPPTHGTWELPWESDERPASYPSEALAYEKELERYQGDDLGDLVGWLGTLVEPGDFGDASHRAAATRLLRGEVWARGGRSAAHPPRPSVEQLLRQCRESIANADERRLGELTTLLAERARDRVTDQDRRTYRVFVRANPIRPPERLGASAVLCDFFEVLLRLLYAARMRAVDVEEMLVDLGVPHRPGAAPPAAVLAAMGRLLPSSAPSGRLLIAHLLGPEHLHKVLATMSEEELCDVAVRSRNRKVLEIVLDEADRRALPSDPRGMEAVRYALARHRYLIEAISSVHAAEESVLCYREVLQVGHRRDLTRADIKEILADLDSPPRTFLLAMMTLCAPGTAPALLQVMAGGTMRELSLTGTPVADDVRAGIDRMFSRDGDGRAARYRRSAGLRRLGPASTPGKVLAAASVVMVVAALALLLWP